MAETGRRLETLTRRRLTRYFMPENKQSVMAAVFSFSVINRICYDDRSTFRSRFIFELFPLLPLLLPVLLLSVGSSQERMTIPRQYAEESSFFST